MTAASPLEKVVGGVDETEASTKAMGFISDGTVVVIMETEGNTAEICWATEHGSQPNGVNKPLVPVASHDTSHHITSHITSHMTSHVT
jgi:hypothetical protein